MLVELGLNGAQMLVKAIAPKIMKRIKRKMNKKVEFKTAPIVNVSDHPFAPQAIKILEEWGYEDIVNVKVGNVNVNKIEEEALKIVEKIAEAIGQNLLTGNFILNNAGLSPLAQTITTYLHGLSGHFPNLLILERQNGVVPTLYLPVKILSLQTLRDEIRVMRHEI